jgi:Bacterial PH domain
LIVSYTLSYPRRVKLARLAIVVLLAVAALIQWVQAWIHFIQPLTQGISLAAVPLRPLIAANLGLVLTVASMALVILFLPDLALRDDGLAVRTLFGWRVMPWTAITAVRTITFAQSSRKLVLVQGSGGRRISWLHLVSAFLGAGFRPGILFTSAIRDFEPLVSRLRQEVTQATPEAVLDDRFFSLPARLASEPAPTLDGLAEQSRQGDWALSTLAQPAKAMVSVTVGLLVVLLLLLAYRGGAWWKPIALVGLGAIEWAGGALYFYALGAFMPGEVELHQGAFLYPFPQIPRALLALPMAMLVVAGLPFLATVVGLAAIVWAVVLTALLLQQVYRLPSILPAMAGAALQALAQCVVLVFIFM